VYPLSTSGLNIKVYKMVKIYLESINMKFTFTPEINFDILMDDDPANILI